MASGREKAAARVAQEIVQTIHAEGLEPGDRYLSEQEALARHGVSRATFREALRFLEFQGVVSVRAGPGGGAVVAKPDWPRLTSTFALLLQFADASLAEVMGARRALEPGMAALAARQASPDQVARLSALLAEAEAAVADRAAFTAVYRQWWTTLAAATGNPVTAMLWPALRALIDSGDFAPNERYRGTLTGFMRDLLEAVAGRDEDRAAALVGEIDKAFHDRLSALYPKRLSRRICWSDVAGI